MSELIDNAREWARELHRSSVAMANASEYEAAAGSREAAKTLEACAAEIERLRADLARVTQERDELATIVSRLDHTDDGVPIVTRMQEVWQWTRHDEPRIVSTPAYMRHLCRPSYSTREAAEAAREGE